MDNNNNIDNNEQTLDMSMMNEQDSNENNFGSVQVQIQEEVNETKQKFIASMMLACVGDVIGYHNGQWEFCFDGDMIHEDCKKRYGSVINITPSHKKGWIHSDDTTMHYATAEALCHDYKDLDDLMKLMAKEYIECWDDMDGRAPGPTCGYGVRSLMKGTPWNKIPYNKSGGGCGGSMRAMCIGLRFCGTENRDMLVACGIESGRLTHNHVVGFIGSMISAAFTALAIEGIEPKKWGHILMTDLLPRSEKYLKNAERDYTQISEDLIPLKEKLRDYLKLRNIENGENDPVFPNNYGVRERDFQYKQWSFSGWGGASGDDSVMIAYDALLSAGNNWEELLNRSALHGGDSDSTGTIACAWYGAYYGWKNVPQQNYKDIEKADYLKKLAEIMYKQRFEKQNLNSDHPPSSTTTLSSSSTTTTTTFESSPTTSGDNNNDLT